MAISASAVAIVVATAVAAAAASAYAQYQAGQAQAKAYQYQARQAENQALAARQAAQVREVQDRERTDRIRASIRARAAASGVISSEGAPLLVMMETARQAELQAQLIRYGGEVQAQTFEAESRFQTFRGRMARRGANIQAGATLLSGVSSGVSAYYGARTTSAPPQNPNYPGG